MEVGHNFFGIKATSTKFGSFIEAEGFHIHYSLQSNQKSFTIGLGPKTEENRVVHFNASWPYLLWH
jgi:hypothetical protein